MRNGFLLALGTLLLGAGVGRAQSPYVARTGPDAQAVPTGVQVLPVIVDKPEAGAAGPRYRPQAMGTKAVSFLVTPEGNSGGAAVAGPRVSVFPWAKPRTRRLAARWAAGLTGWMDDGYVVVPSEQRSPAGLLLTSGNAQTAEPPILATVKFGPEPPPAAYAIVFPVDGTGPVRPADANQLSPLRNGPLSVVMLASGGSPSAAAAGAPTVTASMTGAQDPAGSGVWADAGYLHWWVRSGPLAAPLLTTGNPLDAVPGALGQPGTSALFGGDGLHYGSMSGFQANMGAWLDGSAAVGAEVGGFMLAQRNISYANTSNGAGSPPLYIPVFNAALGREGSYAIADPVAGFAGSFAARSTTNLWGLESNMVFNLARNRGVSVDALAGFRYLDLNESLTVNTDSTDLVFSTQTTTADYFGTRNQFFGGQFGLRGRLEGEMLWLSVTGKLALGENCETLSINGASNFQGPGAGIFPGGIFTQPTNLGRFTQNDFGIVPQLTVQAGWKLTPQLKAFVGYDLFYWSDVLRASNAVDRVVNATQALGGALVGPGRPVPQTATSGFLAQGINLGLSFQY